MALTNRQKQAAFRKRKQAAGYVQINAWVHKDDMKKVSDFIWKINEARKPIDKPE